MNKIQRYYSLFFVAALAVLPVLAVEVPRFLAFGPGLTGLIFYFAYRPVFDKSPEISGPVFYLILAVIGLAALSILWAAEPETALERTLKLAALMIPGGVLLSLVKAIDPETLKPYIKLISAGLAVAALLISAELLLDAPLYRLIRSIEASKPVPDAVFNRGAVTAAICFFPAFGLLKTKLTRTQAVLLLGTPMLFMLLLVESQSAQLALIIGAITALAFPYRHKAAWYGLMAVITALILAAPFLSMWLFDNFAADIHQLPWIGRGGGFGAARLEIWDFIARYALDSPVYGHGIEVTRTVEEFDTAQLYEAGRTSALHPHNFALQLWIEFGLIGALFGAAFCTYLLRLMQTRLNVKQARIALPTFMTSLSVAATGYGMWQGWWIGLLFLGCALCLIAVKEKAQT